MDRPLRIGLTGGIASGKSTVADLFAENDVPIIDTDVIAHQLVRPGEPALDEIRSAFGVEVFNAQDELDRGALREIIFSDSSRREELESILHPRIRDEAIAQSEAADGTYQVIVVPLLVGSPLQQFIDRVLVVDCDENTQVSRLLARDAENEDQARRIIAAQASRDERLSLADDIIFNNDDIASTRRQVEDLHRKYLSL